MSYVDGKEKHQNILSIIHFDNRVKLEMLGFECFMVANLPYLNLVVGNLFLISILQHSILLQPDLIFMPCLLRSGVKKM